MSEESKNKKSGEYVPLQGASSEHSLTTPEGRKLSYSAQADWIVLRKKEKPAAEIFHVAYLANGKTAPQRPITFIFNGGPGAASAYLHVGLVGPRRVLFDKQGSCLKPPVRLAENRETWLTFSDLVFVDPVGTGFSRIIKERGAEPGKEAPGKDESRQPPQGQEKEESEFYQIKRDLESLGEFIQKFLSKHNRWDSPAFIVGESYGGFRVAKLARQLQQGYGVGLNGAVLVSPALEFNFLEGSDYDILPWTNVFPSMAAAAVFHGRSRAFKAKTPIKGVLEEAEHFAHRELAKVLIQGEGLGGKERTEILGRTADYLGLPGELVQRAGGRISPRVFSRQLLREQSLVCGLYDASITILDPFPDREGFEGPDPTLFSIERVFTAGINLQLRKNLQLQSERDYHLLSFEVNRSWKEDPDKAALEPPAGSVDDLRYGMTLNPHMKVFITHGYYDLVTPYYASSRIAQMMKLAGGLEKNLQVQHFEGGHMFYTWEKSRKAFTVAMKRFYQQAV